MVQGAGGVGVEGHELVVDGARAPGRLSRQRRLSNLGSGLDLPRRLGPAVSLLAALRTVSSLRDLIGGGVSTTDTISAAHTGGVLLRAPVRL